MKYKDFHPAIQAKIAERQKEQGVEPNMDIDYYEGSAYGGFYWTNTAEGQTFWEEVLDYEREDVFFKKYPLQEERDPIVEAVRADLLSRSQVGIKKYGVTLSRTDLGLKEWLQHLLEETYDSALYIKRAIQELDNTKEDKPKQSLPGYLDKYERNPNRLSTNELLQKK